MIDMILDALSNASRRRVLLTIASDNPRSQADFIPDEIDAEEETKLAILLQHQHFPYLDNAGFIDWDRDADTIERGSNFQNLRPFLRIVEDNDDEMNPYQRN